MVDVYDSGKKDKDFVERVIHVNRVDKVVKGGRRFSFSALVVVGNEDGKVGLGYGKAPEVADAIRKSIERAKKEMFIVPMVQKTIPHEILTKLGAAKVLLKPAARGTGVIAGGAVRAILEVAGIQDILAKSLGTDNALNIAKATIKGLRDLKDVESVAKMRGKDPKEILG